MFDTGGIKQADLINNFSRRRLPGYRDHQAGLFPFQLLRRPGVAALISFPSDLPLYLRRIRLNRHHGVGRSFVVSQKSETNIFIADLHPAADRVCWPRQSLIDSGCQSYNKGQNPECQRAFHTEALFSYEFNILLVIIV
jgi:hypothetical protein